jgi:hypothetical protein
LGFLHDKMNMRSCNKFSGTFRISGAFRKIKSCKCPAKSKCPAKFVTR